MTGVARVHMRVTITLIALVFAASIVSGQDALAPTPRPVYPLCEISFSLAAQRASASPDPSAIFVEPGPLASPLPLGASPFLDDAIRRCASVEEFSAAAALYPQVLGETDPVQFLLARCADPLGGLGVYAVCASLVRALATPSPAPTATPIPSPTPEPTARPATGSKQKPGTGKKSTRRPKPRSDWTKAAARTLRDYYDSTYGTYVLTLYRPISRLKNMDCAGVSDKRCQALRTNGAAIVRKSRTTIDRHLAFMRKHPPARCFSDAYAKDRVVAKRLLRGLDEWRPLPPETMRERSQRIGRLHMATLDHVKNLNRYTRDCP